MPAAKILILDGEPLVRSVVTSILEREGYDVHAASDLREVRERVRTLQPDLLLTNVNIPGSTGHAAAKLLRSECPEMAVLMVAGLPDDEAILRRTADDEAYDFFPKPFTAAELRAKVKELLEKRPRPHDAS